MSAPLSSENLPPSGNALSDPARLSTLNVPLPTNPGPTVDLEHPWLGLDSFSESHRRFFFGRETEAEELLLRVHNSPLTVLYGRSGLGKTSLLRAALIPRLQDEGARPIVLRLDLTRRSPGEGQSAADPALLPPRPTAQILGSLFPQPQPPFPRESLPADDLSCLWLHLHRTDAPAPYTHLLFDQFEEIFRGGAELPGFDDDLLAALALLLEGTAPEPVRKAISADRTLLEHFQLTVPPLNLLLSLRDDWLFALNRWRRRLPILGSNHYELLPLRGTAALDAVYEPGALRTHLREENGALIEGDTDASPIIPIEVARRLVRRLAKAGDETPLDQISAVPPLLSIVCQQLNADRFKHRGTPDDPTPDQVATTGQAADPDRILRTYYEDSFAGRPPGVRRVIEEQLLSGDGYRQPRRPEFLLQELIAEGVPTADAQSHLDALLTRRLLTTNQTAEEPRLELTHDVLCRIVAESRAAREQREAKERADREKAQAEERERQERERAEKLTRMRNTLRVVAYSAIALMVTSIYFAWKNHAESKRSDELAKKSEADATRLLVANTKQDLLLEEASRADYLHALEYFDRDDWGKGVALLTRALRSWPENPTASAQLWYQLRYGDVSRALAPERFIPLPQGTRKFLLDGKLLWSPDSRWIVSRSSLGNFLIDLAHGDAIREIESSGSVISWSQFSSDSRFLVGSSSTRKVARFSVSPASNSKVELMPDLASELSRFSPDASSIASASPGEAPNTIFIRDPETGKPRKEIALSPEMFSPRPKSMTVTELAWSEDGKRLAVAIKDGDSDSYVAVRDVQSGAPVGRTFHFNASIRVLIFDPTGHILLAATVEERMPQSYFIPFERGEAEIKDPDENFAARWGPLMEGGEHSILLWYEALGKIRATIAAPFRIGSEPDFGDTNELPFLDANSAHFSADMKTVMLASEVGFQIFHLPGGETLSALESASDPSTLGRFLSQPHPGELNDLSGDGLRVARAFEKGIGIFKLAEVVPNTKKPELSKTWGKSSSGVWELEPADDNHLTLVSESAARGPVRVTLRFPDSRNAGWEPGEDVLGDMKGTRFPWTPELASREEVLEAAQLIGGWRFNKEGALEAIPFVERLEWVARMKAVLPKGDGWSKVAQWWLDGRPAPKEEVWERKDPSIEK